MRVREFAAGNAARLLVISLLFTAAGPRLAKGQAVKASITGLIRDPSGAVVVGVKVHATNVDTNLDFNSETDESGNYSIRGLNPGNYRVEADAQGFKHVVLNGIVVNVDQQARVDITLQVGEASQRINVEATTPLIDTESPLVGGVIPDKGIVGLPLNGRNFMELTTLTGGMNEGGPSNAKGGIINRGFAPSAAGMPAQENNYQLDGAANGEYFFNTFNVAPPVDAVQEFRVQVGQYSAEFGQGGGAVISVVTKSGTNQFHGTLWEFVRNEIFDARNFFLPPGQEKSPLHRNQYGVAGGGPVLVPGLYNGKDRTFFSASYEGTRLSRGFFKSGNEPTPAQRAGDFSGYSKIIKDPLSGLPFPGNIIPANRISSISSGLASYLDNPNNSNPSQNIAGNQPGHENLDAWLVRGDHRFNSNNDLFGRYASQEVDRFTPSFLSRIGGLIQPQHYQNAALGLTSNLKPNLLNEFRFAYNRSINRSRGQTTGQPIAANLGVPFAYTDPIRSGFVELISLGNSPFSSFGEAMVSQVPWFLTVNSFQWYDGVTWVHGKHNVKAGADISRIRSDAFLGTHGNNQYTFNGQFTGEGFADFLLGFPSNSLMQFTPNETGRFRRTGYEFYALDDWKVSSRLTLNLGVRYEYRTPPFEVSGLSSIFDPTLGNGTGGLAFPNNNKDAIPWYSTYRPDLPVRLLNRDTMYSPDKNNVAPRVGLAYRPFGNNRTVIRGGFGIYYSSAALNNIVQNSLTAPPAQQWPTFVSDINRPTLNYGGLIGVPVSDAFKTATFGIITGPEAHFLDGQTMQYSLSLSHETSKGLVLEATYLGSRSNHLEEAYDYNFTAAGPGAVAARVPYPKWGRLYGFSSGGTAMYNSLMLTAERRLSGGLTFKGSYTVGRVVGSNGGRAAGIQNPANLRLEKGPTNDDVTHRFTGLYVYELPFGRGKRFLTGLSRPANAVIGGWTLAGITTFRTGFFLNPSVPSANCNASYNNSCRPDAVGMPAFLGATGVDAPRWDRSAFDWPQNTGPNRPAQPPRYGNAGPNTLLSNGLNNWDMSLQKIFRLDEMRRFEFRAETFNTFNHAQFGDPTTDLSNPLFGRVFATRVDPRDVQFALKFYW
jgi:hypothetical protein